MQKSFQTFLLTWIHVKFDAENRALRRLDSWRENTRLDTLLDAVVLIMNKKDDMYETLNEQLEFYNEMGCHSNEDLLIFESLKMFNDRVINGFNCVKRIQTHVRNIIHKDSRDDFRIEFLTIMNDILECNIRLDARARYILFSVQKLLVDASLNDPVFQGKLQQLESKTTMEEGSDQNWKTLTYIHMLEEWKELVQPRIWDTDPEAMIRLAETIKSHRMEPNYEAFWNHLRQWDVLWNLFPELDRKIIGLKYKATWEENRDYILMSLQREALHSATFNDHFTREYNEFSKIARKDMDMAQQIRWLYLNVVKTWYKDDEHARTIKGILVNKVENTCPSETPDTV